jgi:hypothetical protein
MPTMRRRLSFVLSPVVAAAPAAVQAPAPPHDTAALAKETQNPVSDLISIPVRPGDVRHVAHTIRAGRSRCGRRRRP